MFFFLFVSQKNKTQKLFKKFNIPKIRKGGACSRDYTGSSDVNQDTYCASDNKVSTYVLNWKKMNFFQNFYLFEKKKQQSVLS